jgi:dTDP-4-dehydrorhamnose reductase
VTAAGLAGLRPVVVGSEGRAGRAIAHALAAVAPHTVAATRTEMDISDYFNLRWELERLEADLVVNAAGLADVDACESSPAAAFALNAEAAGLVAEAARVGGLGLIHLSSDYVFDGRKGAPYRETDAPAPLSVYGQSKLAGERLVQERLPEAMIVRTAWLFGGRGRRPDFAEKILEAAREATRIPVVDDQVGSPTAVDDLGRGVLDLIVGGAQGVVHVACSGGASRAEFARTVLSVAGVAGVEVIPAAAGQVHTVAQRPADSRLDTALFRRLTGHPLRDWREAVWDVLSRRPAEA